LIEILSIDSCSWSIEFISKRIGRRGLCEADKSWTSIVGVVPISPRVRVGGFGTYYCSSGISRRPARRTRNDCSEDTSSVGERWYSIYRRKRWRVRCATSQANQTKTLILTKNRIRALNTWRWYRCHGLMIANHRLDGLKPEFRPLQLQVASPRRYYASTLETENPGAI
jgi:hypothetical protein